MKYSTTFQGVREMSGDHPIAAEDTPDTRDVRGSSWRPALNCAHLNYPPTATSSFLWNGQIA